MNVAGLRSKTISAWIPVDEEVKVLCNHLDQKGWEDFRAQATTIEIVDGESKENFDAIKFRHLVGRHVVRDVSGLTDGIDETSKEDLPFLVTPENVDMLMDSWTEFRMTIMGTPLVLRRMLELQAAQNVKNSLRTLPEKSTTRKSAVRRAPKQKNLTV